MNLFQKRESKIEIDWDEVKLAHLDRLLSQIDASLDELTKAMIKLDTSTQKALEAAKELNKAVDRARAERKRPL